MVPVRYRPNAASGRQSGGVTGCCTCDIAIAILQYSHAHAHMHIAHTHSIAADCAVYLTAAIHPCAKNREGNTKLNQTFSKHSYGSKHIW